jgi:hypothetical protein
LLHNPTGFALSAEKKLALVNLLNFDTSLKKGDSLITLLEGELFMFTLVKQIKHNITL